MLAAGLKGIEEGYELPDGAEDDVWALTDAERRALGIEPLPASLADAIRQMEESELVAETLGEHVFDFFLRNKRAGVAGLPPAGHAVRARPLPPAAVTAEKPRLLVVQHQDGAGLGRLATPTSSRLASTCAAPTPARSSRTT